MSYKFFLYAFVTIIVIWAMDSVNINQIFKKNKIVQARVFYFLLGISIIAVISTVYFSKQSFLGEHFFYPFIPFDFDGIKDYFKARSNQKRYIRRNVAATKDQTMKRTKK